MSKKSMKEVIDEKIKEFIEKTGGTEPHVILASSNAWARLWLEMADGTGIEYTDAENENTAAYKYSYKGIPVYRTNDLIDEVFKVY